MRVTLAPTLSESEKVALRLWLIQTLESENLCNPRTFPIPSRRLVVYIDNTSVVLFQGTWEKDSSEIYLGRENAYNNNPENPPLRDRLSILLTLTQLCEPSAELTKACSEAITHYLLGEYRSVSSQLVSAPVPVSGLAFCTDNRVASLLGSEWLLPSGEVVDVSGPEWTVCTGAAPPASETSSSRFQLGQRVRWNGGGYGIHDGEITRIPTPRRNHYGVTEDNTTLEWAAAESELTAL